MVAVKQWARSSMDVPCLVAPHHAEDGDEYVDMPKVEQTLPDLATTQSKRQLVCKSSVRQRGQVCQVGALAPGTLISGLDAARPTPDRTLDRHHEPFPEQDKVTLPCKQSVIVLCHVVGLLTYAKRQIWIACLTVTRSE